MQKTDEQPTPTTDERSHEATVARIASILNPYILRHTFDSAETRELAGLLHQILLGSGTTFTEQNITDMDEETKERRLVTRLGIESELDLILYTLHTLEPVKPGEQWTLSIGSPCGFSGQLIFQVNERGSCDPAEVAEQRDKLIEHARTCMSGGHHHSHSGETIH